MVTVTKTDGSTSTFNIKNGSKGSTGPNGTRGSLIYWGTAITGTSTTATIFSSSGISSALVNDLYLNTSTWNIYQCTVAGAASAAKWVYKGNIKGATGATGSKGDTGATGAQGLKGDTGAAAGFGTPTASIDANVGTPSVTVTASGSNTAKVFNFAFKNLKGEKGAKGDPGTNATTTATGNASTAGLTKLYTGTGSNTDGSMTQSAITNALNGKAPTNHGTHVTFTTTTPAANGTASVGTASSVARSDHIHPKGGATSVDVSGFDDFDYAVPIALLDTELTGTSGISDKDITVGRQTDLNYNPVSGTLYSPTVNAGTFNGSLAGNANTATTANKATSLSTSRSIDGVSFNGNANVIHYGSCTTSATTQRKDVSCSNFALVTGAIIRVKFTYTNSATNPTLYVNNTSAKYIYYMGTYVNPGVLKAGIVYEFIYDGSAYNLVGEYDESYTFPKSLSSTSISLSSSPYYPCKIFKFPISTYDNLIITPSSESYEIIGSGAFHYDEFANYIGSDFTANKTMLRNCKFATSSANRVSVKNITFINTSVHTLITDTTTSNTTTYEFENCEFFVDSSDIATSNPSIRLMTLTNSSVIFKNCRFYANGSSDGNCIHMIDIAQTSTVPITVEANNCKLIYRHTSTIYGPDVVFVTTNG